MVEGGVETGTEGNANNISTADKLTLAFQEVRPTL